MIDDVKPSLAESETRDSSYIVKTHYMKSANYYSHDQQPV